MKPLFPKCAPSSGEVSTRAKLRMNPRAASGAWSSAQLNSALQLRKSSSSMYMKAVWSPAHAVRHIDLVLAGVCSAAAQLCGRLL